MKIWTLITEWFASRRKKSALPASPEIGSPKPPPTNPAHNPFAIYSGMRLAEVYLARAQRAQYGVLTPVEMEQAKAAGVIFPEVRDNGVAVDPSGFHLGGETGEGLVKVNRLENGRIYSFTYTIRPDTTTAEIWVFGVSGTQLLAANGVTGDAARKHVVRALPGTHTFPLAVQTVGGMVGVQLRQS